MPTGQPTGQQPLTLENIPQIDQGRIAVAFNQAIRNLAADVIDRPGESKPRKLTFTVELTPVLEKETGKLDLINNQFKIKATTPDRQSVPYPAMPSGEDSMYIRPESPQDPRQGDFYSYMHGQQQQQGATPEDGHEPMGADGAS